MRKTQRVDRYADVVEARSPDDPVLTVKLGLGEASFQQDFESGLFTAVAQYYGIVQDDLFNAIHLFRGLKRPLQDGQDPDADKNVLIYTWRPRFDYVWTRSAQGGSPTSKDPPPSRVFAVLVRLEPIPQSFPSVGTVIGSIEKWNWIKEDSSMLGAPVDWRERYETRVWSR